VETNAYRLIIPRPGIATIERMASVAEVVLLGNHDLEEIIAQWNVSITSIRFEVKELKNPNQMPIEMISCHHYFQQGFAAYRLLMEASGFGQHPAHLENVALYEAYVAALPVYVNR
jgi:ABC-type thiamin/hydroxymethylpyrimidine transport system permease subunit